MRKWRRKKNRRERERERELGKSSNSRKCIDAMVPYKTHQCYIALHRHSGNGRLVGSLVGVGRLRQRLLCAHIWTQSKHGGAGKCTIKDTLENILNVCLATFSSMQTCGSLQYLCQCLCAVCCVFGRTDGHTVHWQHCPVRNKKPEMKAHDTHCILPSISYKTRKPFTEWITDFNRFKTTLSSQAILCVLAMMLTISTSINTIDFLYLQTITWSLTT